MTTEENIMDSNNIHYHDHRLGFWGFLGTLVFVTGAVKVARWAILKKEIEAGMCPADEPKDY
jgi:hypothetical protein